MFFALTISVFSLIFVDDFMKDEYDFSDGVVKNYSDKFTREEKLKAMLECFIAVEKISKDELRREVNLILA